MTFVPEGSWFCFCWSRAPFWVREAEKFMHPRNSFSPRGLRSCQWCHGAGYGRSEDYDPAMLEEVRHGA